MRIAPKIDLDAAVQRELTALARRGRVEARVQQRAKIVLLAAQGRQNKDIAAEVDLDRRQVALWRQRFLEGGVQALMHDAPRPGRTPSVTTAEFGSSIVDKLLDVVGLYLNPPERALVLSCDEKSQIQALNRTQPGLPMKKGRAGTLPTITSATARPRCSLP